MNARSLGCGGGVGGGGCDRHGRRKRRFSGSANSETRCGQKNRTRPGNEETKQELLLLPTLTGLVDGLGRKNRPRADRLVHPYRESPVPVCKAGLSDYVSRDMMWV